MSQLKNAVRYLLQRPGVWHSLAEVGDALRAAGAPPQTNVGAVLARLVKDEAIQRSGVRRQSCWRVGATMADVAAAHEYLERRHGGARVGAGRKAGRSATPTRGIRAARAAMRDLTGALARPLSPGVDEHDDDGVAADLSEFSVAASEATAANNDAGARIAAVDHAEACRASAREVPRFVIVDVDDDGAGADDDYPATLTGGQGAGGTGREVERMHYPAEPVRFVVDDDGDLSVVGAETGRGYLLLPRAECARLVKLARMLAPKWDAEAAI